MPPRPKILLLSGLLLAGLALSQQGIRSGVGPAPMLGVPAVPVPADNPMSAAKVGLGRLLFFDKRLSRDGKVACATCHRPELAYADGRPVAVGIAGQAGRRNTPTLLNTGYNLSQFLDGRAKSLELQALQPIGNPLEMGSSVKAAVGRLAAVAAYRRRFRQVFGAGVTAVGLGKALAAFERTLVSGNAPWDRHNVGDLDAISAAAMRGIVLFHTKGRCSLCHVGPTFTDNAFHNLGVGMDGKHPDLGRHEVTGRERDRGAFKTPSLRNVAQTAPYMHDGSLKTLMEVVDFYNKGGIENPQRDQRMFPREFTDAEKLDLVEFLQTLTGDYPRVKEPKPLR